MGLYLFYYCYILQHFIGEHWPITAIATINVPNGVKAKVTFTQETCTDPVQITAVVKGLKGCHDFRIHELGDLTEGCNSLGSYWNPYHENDHENDFPDVCVNSTNTKLTLDLKKNGIHLAGPLSIVGRSIVLHKRKRDYKKTNGTETETTKKCKTKVGCAIIGLKSTPKLKENKIY